MLPVLHSHRQVSTCMHVHVYGCMRVAEEMALAQLQEDAIMQRYCLL